METKIDDLLDRLVAEYQDALAAGGSPDPEPFLEQVSEDHRVALGRCLRLMRAGAASAPRASKALLPGVQIAGYQLVREIGRGGVSIVYLATQLDLRRPVALKVLRPGLSVEASHVERFEREALSIARLQHPHIVQVHAVGHDEGWHWIAMEYVEGKNLAQVFAKMIELEPEPARWTADLLAECAGIASAPFAGLDYPAALCKLLSPVARAIGVAHEIGLVHRDVKPSNILVHKDGRALIADFGLAKGDGDPGLSLTGEPLGTPYYMSPEQAQLVQTPVDRRTDVYSFGVTIYEGLCARRPFEGKDVLAVLDAIRTQQPPPLGRHLPKVPRRVEAVVDRAMAKDARDRYTDAFDLARDLEALAQNLVPLAVTLSGGEWRRFTRVLSMALAGHAAEYRSRAHFLGIPLVHVQLGPRLPGQGPRVARGWVAWGPRAIGGIAFGGSSVGIIAVGGLAFGGLGFGGLASGLLAFGGFACGGLSFGGMTAGVVTIGGMATGYYAVGGEAYGAHEWDHETHDPEVEALFDRLGVELPDSLSR
jgi:serine/threonine protein kinase